MNKILLLLLTAISLASCGDSFKIKGSTDISPIDGQKLYLKTLVNNEPTIIDSCEVIHGSFSFKGNVDTTKLAAIYIGEEEIVQLILENTNINININQQEISVTGTALNDTLNNFFKSMSSFSYKAEELNSKRNEAIMDGKDLDSADSTLMLGLLELDNKRQGVITDYIKKNYDNIIGPSIFKFIISKTYAQPILDNWIESIMIEATEKFKNDKFVKDFYAKAQDNMDILNGMKTPASEEQ